MNNKNKNILIFTPKGIICGLKAQMNEKYKDFANRNLCTFCMDRTRIAKTAALGQCRQIIEFLSLGNDIKLQLT